MQCREHRLASNDRRRGSSVHSVVDVIDEEAFLGVGAAASAVRGCSCVATDLDLGVVMLV